MISIKLFSTGVLAIRLHWKKTLCNDPMPLVFLLFVEKHNLSTVNQTQPSLAFKLRALLFMPYKLIVLFVTASKGIAVQLVHDRHKSQPDANPTHPQPNAKGVWIAAFV